jgi:hypothetical protein
LNRKHRQAFPFGEAMLINFMKWRPTGKQGVKNSAEAINVRGRVIVRRLPSACSGETRSPLR